MFGWVIDKMTIWRAVQETGRGIDFDLDPKELPQGEADGTGIPIQGIKKRGKEMKVFVQLKRGGGVRIAGLSIGDYDSGWDRLFKPLIETVKKFNSFLLVTDGDTNIFRSLKGKVEVLIRALSLAYTASIEVYPMERQGEEEIPRMVACSGRDT